MNDEPHAGSPVAAAEPGPWSVHGVAGTEPESPFEGVVRRTHQTEHATVTAYRFEAGAVFPMHSHPEEQITVYLEGEMEVTLGGRISRVGPGETVVIAGGLPHSMRALSPARFVAVVVPRRSRPDAYELTGN